MNGLFRLSLLGISVCEFIPIEVSRFDHFVYYDVSFISIRVIYCVVIQTISICSSSVIQASLRRGFLRSVTSQPFSAMADPLQCPDYFSLRDVISVEGLFNARAHLGHRSLLRNPYMTPYIFGTRLEIDIFDLDQTAELLFDALNFTAHIAYRGGIILFMMQHQQVRQIFTIT